MNTVLIPSSGWTPTSRQDPFLDTYRSSTLHDLQQELRKPKKDFKHNLKKNKLQALTKLRKNKDITIKPADNGGGIVILNTQDYISECLWQLNNAQHYEYERLQIDPTKRSQNQVNRTEPSPKPTICIL